MSRQPVRAPGIDALVVGVLALVTYLWTMPPTVTLEDSGLLAMAAWTGGIPQMPGYPLWTGLAWASTWLPVGPPVVRVQWLSALCGAATCAVSWRVIHRWTGRRAAAWAGALGLAWAPAFWSQAIVVEVYTLNTLLLAGVLLVLSTPPERVGRRTAVVLGGLYGLAVSHHWPLVGLTTPGLLLLAWPLRKALGRRIGWLAGTFGAGLLLPWLGMWARSLQEPAVSFYGPIRSLGALWFFVTRQGYRGLYAGPNVTSSPAEKLDFALFLGGEALAQLTVVGAVLAVLGVSWAWRRLGVVRAVGLVAAFLGPSFVLLGFAWGTPGYLQEAVFRPFPLPAWMILALCAGLGVAEVQRWADDRGPPFGLVPAAVGIGLLALLVIRLPGADRSDDTWARDYALAVLQALPPDAVLVLHGDIDTHTVGYLHLVEGVRPDVRILHREAVVFSDRLTAAGAPEEEKAAALAVLIARTPRPVFSTGRLPGGWSQVNFGILSSVDRSDGGAPRAALDRRLLAFYEHALDWRPRTRWEVVHRAEVLHAAGWVLAVSVHLGGVEDPQAVALYEGLMDTFWGCKGRLEALLTRVPVERAAAWIAQLQAEVDETVQPDQQARLDYLEGVIALRGGRVEEGLAALIASAERLPAPEVLEAVADVLVRLDDAERYRRWRATVRLDGRPPPPGVARADARFGISAGGE